VRGAVAGRRGPRALTSIGQPNLAAFVPEGLHDGSDSTELAEALARSAWKCFPKAVPSVESLLSDNPYRTMRLGTHQRSQVNAYGRSAPTS
jgi:hypothetical protein